MSAPDRSGDGDAKHSTLPGPAVPLAPESPAASWTRRMILAAFWIVIVTLGLPHWVWTTSIHRSNLPLDSMNAWAEGKVFVLTGAS